MSLRWRGLLLVICSVLATLGCSPGFYMSESEAAVFRANLRNEASANDLLSSLEGKLLRVEFSGSGSNVRVASSNLVEILRGIPNFLVLEQGFRQIRLDRLSRQIEQDFGPWTAGRVQSLQGTTGVRIGLQRATVRFLSAPTISYSEPQQSLSFEAPIALTLGGSFEVNGDRYAASLAFDRFLLRGQMRLGRPFAQSARTWLRLTPAPGAVRIGGGIPSQYHPEIQFRIRRSFSSPLEQPVRLFYDYFALSGLKLSNGDLDFQYHDRPETAPPVLNVVVAEGGKLYYTRRSSGDWAPFEEVPLPGRGGTAPALAASGQGQLELAFVSSSGEFVSLARRQGEWVNAFQSPSEGATLFGGWKPALIATAPGQVEAVVVGRDGRLYHFRRKNGAWIGPRRLDDSLLAALPPGAGGGTLPLRNPVGVQSGSKFFLFFVDSASRLFAVVFDMETGYWGQTGFLGGAGVSFGLSAASCGDGRVDVLSLAPDGAVYQHTLVPQTGNIGPNSGSAFGVVGQPIQVGWSLTAGPAAACSGFKELQVVGQGPENSMFHARQYDGRWEGWQDAGGHLPGSLLPLAIEGYGPAIASTRDGAIHVVTRRYGVPPKGLVYNNHITTRFPLAPAATHWRGFQRIGSREFFGMPALALFDRQLAVTTRGADHNVWQTALAEENVARFARVQNSQVPFPWEPVTLSSGPRALEVLYPAEDGTIRHVRLLNRYEERHTLPRAPAPGDARPVAAVTFGGQIEVVSGGSNGILYHWRFISGVWSQPTAVGGPVLSNPLLADVGSGQLELLAVADDQRLHRWRFINGAWSPWGALRTGFPVSSLAFGPGAASSWGDGTLDVAVVHAGTGAVHHARLRPTDLAAGGRYRPGRTTVPRFRPVGETASDVPLLSALAPDLLHLVADRSGALLAGTTVRIPLVMTASRRRGRRTGPQAPPLTWRRFQPIMAPSNLLLGNLVTVGERELALIAINREGRAYLARYAEPHWGVALPLGAQTTESMSTSLTRPALALH